MICQAKAKKYHSQFSLLSKRIRVILVFLTSIQPLDLSIFLNSQGKFGSLYPEKEAMTYNKMNTYIGWLVFLIATIVYFMTIEDTVSLWDCGEYITAAYKLEVGHPPGAPFFMVLGRLFSFFAAPENVAVWINRLSALSSSATILFMFWSLTLLLRKIATRGNSILSKADQFAIYGSAFVGSLAYTFSDSFWFSAVEGEVYAMSSLFTAIIFWAILKWDAEMALVQNGTLSEEVAPNRWLLMIMFMLGLAIGVHLLGILVVPAISFVIYFRFKETATLKGIILTGILSIFILGFIQEAVIPGSISMASSFEVAFVNSMGLPFYSGTIFFFVLLIVACIWLLRYARKKSKTILYNATMGLILLLIGYGSFAVIVIRSNANTPLDENDPENLVTLHSYLKREQYGSAPILFGPYWNSNENTQDQYDSRSPFYLRRFVVTKNEKVEKAFKKEADAKEFAQKIGGSYEEKYFESNANDRENVVPTYAQTTFFPRMYYSLEPTKISGYKYWSGYDPTEPGEMGNDGARLPTMGENLRYFFSYQVNWMYTRYFLWNFAGRQNDFQGHGDALKGNWLSGINTIDSQRLGDQGEFAPFFTSENPSNNKFFFIPLILGLLGFFFHCYRTPKDAFVVFLAFIFTGLAIVVYLNQKPYEPRERDYAYAGSFYFFALWIGVGVYALYDAYKSFVKKDFMKALMIAGAGLLICLAIDSNGEAGMPITMSWLFMSAVGLGLLGLMAGLRKVLSNGSGGAILATLLGIIAPLLMAVQGWDDHDRSDRTTARDLAMNYLNSCSENGILFTNGDNDTFPLWYMQEVEEYRTDVRVCNLSLMQTDWYTEQMKMRAYESDPLPISFREDQTLMYSGNTDQVLFNGLFDLMAFGADQEIINRIIEMRVKQNPEAAQKAVETFASQMTPIVNQATPKQASVSGRLAQIKQTITAAPGANLAKDVSDRYLACLELLGAVKGQIVDMPQAAFESIYNTMMSFEDSWSTLNLKDAMTFVKDDANMITLQGQRRIRIFPSNQFVLKVNKENLVKQGVIKATEKSKVKDEIRFKFDDRGITKEEVMMMDILANNDWKRGIYYSSPGGSEVAIALLKSGHIKQNGMTFELSPLKSTGQYAADEMYNKLMNEYTWGKMMDPDVLTDFYARRHTSQYRLHFASLAEYYVNKIFEVDNVRQQGQPYIDALRAAGRTDEADEREYLIKNGDKVKAESKKRAAALLKRSLEIMPADVIIDMSDQASPTREKFTVGGAQYSTYQDGMLADYVEMLYIVGEKKLANELGMTLAKQYETVIAHYTNSRPEIVSNPNNHDDLFAALSSYFKIAVASYDPEADPNGPLAKHASQKLMDFYKTDFPRMYKAIEELARAEGESGSSGLYSSRLNGLRGYIDALGIHYHLIDGPKEQAPQVDMNVDPEQLQQMMQQGVPMQ